MKRLVAIIVVGVIALAVTPAQGDHCGSSVYLFSYNRTVQPSDLKLTPGIIACATLGEDGNSDIIFPGSDTFFVRWIAASQPIGGTLTFAGVTTPLVFAPCPPLFGVVPRVCYDSQEIAFDPVDSIDGGFATAVVCDDPEFCDTHTYHTLG